MRYVSYTEPGICRGPHEHSRQTDIFSFIGAGNFKLYLWDNRRESPTFHTKMILFYGEDDPMAVVIPPGIVHVYKNISKTTRGMVLNFPNMLYAGWGKKDPVDEIRHEDEKDTYHEDFIR